MSNSCSGATLDGDQLDPTKAELKKPYMDALDTFPAGSIEAAIAKFDERTVEAVLECRPNIFKPAKACLSALKTLLDAINQPRLCQRCQPLDDFDAVPEMQRATRIVNLVFDSRVKGATDSGYDNIEMINLKAQRDLLTYAAWSAPACIFSALVEQMIDVNLMATASVFGEPDEAEKAEHAKAEPQEAEPRKAGQREKKKEGTEHAKAECFSKARQETTSIMPTEKASQCFSKLPLACRAIIWSFLALDWTGKDSVNLAVTAIGADAVEPVLMPFWAQNPCLVARYHRQFKIIKHLVQLKANLHLPDSNNRCLGGTRPVMVRHTQKCGLDWLRTMLAAPCCQFNNNIGGRACTNLTTAAVQGHLNCMEFFIGHQQLEAESWTWSRLIRQSWFPTIRSYAHFILGLCTPLRAAVQSLQIDAVRKLLDAKANVESDYVGVTSIPILTSALTAPSDMLDVPAPAQSKITIVQMLLAAKASVNVGPGIFINSPLASVDIDIPGSRENYSVAAARMLLDAGAEITGRALNNAHASATHGTCQKLLYDMLERELKERGNGGRGGSNSSVGGGGSGGGCGGGGGGSRGDGGSGSSNNSGSHGSHGPTCKRKLGGSATGSDDKRRTSDR